MKSNGILISTLLCLAASPVLALDARVAKDTTGSPAAVWAAIGQALTAFMPNECANYFENAGYAST